MARVTPRIYATGRYELASPFDSYIAGDRIFICDAIRSFNELEQASVDVFDAFYVEYGISRSKFTQDANEDACIVTLASQDGTLVINVPDTYILHVPSNDAVDYDYIVLSASLGAVPGYLDLSAVKLALKNKLEEVIGIQSDFKENRVPSVGIVTADNDDIAAASRHALMKEQFSQAGVIRELTAVNKDLREKLDTAYGILRDNGLITTI